MAARRSVAGEPPVEAAGTGVESARLCAEGHDPKRRAGTYRSKKTGGVRLLQVPAERTHGLQACSAERSNYRVLDLDRTATRSWREVHKLGVAGSPRVGDPDGHVQSFHGKLRDERPNTNRFKMLNDVQSTLASWRCDYNRERLHSALDYSTSRSFGFKR